MIQSDSWWKTCSEHNESFPSLLADVSPLCLLRSMYWMEELLSVQEEGLNGSCVCEGEIYCPTYER